jgi:hypothetical protein
LVQQHRRECESIPLLSRYLCQIAHRTFIDKAAVSFRCL